MKKFSEWLLCELLIEGYNPERAVLRLKRNGVCMFSLKRIAKNAVTVRIYRKDRQKVFAFFEDSCYNIKKVSPVGLSAALQRAKSRFGCFAGAILFLFLTQATKDVVLKIVVEGNGAYYAREIGEILQDCGVAVGSLYPKKSIALARTHILSLADVSFASVEKSGYVVTVYVRVSPSESKAVSGDLCAEADGVLYSLTVVSGTAQKSAGDSVAAGDVLVSADADGGKTLVIARAEIACEASAAALDEADARAKAAFLCGGEILEESVRRDGELYVVTVRYLLMQSMNLY